MGNENEWQYGKVSWERGRWGCFSVERRKKIGDAIKVYTLKNGKLGTPIYLFSYQKNTGTFHETERPYI